MLLILGIAGRVGYVYDAINDPKCLQNKKIFLELWGSGLSNRLYALASMTSKQLLLFNSPYYIVLRKIVNVYSS
jgi:hypothetical protein